jgi:hypothetical protein
MPAFKTPDDKRNWEKAYWNSAEGKERQWKSVPYVVELKTNGEFRAEDVPPGDYELEIHYHQAATEAGTEDRCLGELHHPFNVPPAAAADVKAVDIGTLKFVFKPTAN